MKEQDVLIRINPDMEVTPIALLVQVAGRYESRIYIDCEDKHVNAKSIMGMMCLSLTSGELVTVTADGPDEEAAIKGMTDYLTGKIRL